MKKIIYTTLCLFCFLSCNTEAPKQFSEAPLNDVFINLDGDEITLKSILEKHKGKTIVVDIWASWCGDCLRNMPKVKALQDTYKDVVYLFLSLDRGQKAWKKGIEKYQVVGEHYYMPNAKKCDFADFVNISWIPRYMVINGASEIVVFNVIEANDEKLIQALKK